MQAIDLFIIMALCSKQSWDLQSWDLQCDSFLHAVVMSSHVRNSVQPNCPFLVDQYALVLIACLVLYNAHALSYCKVAACFDECHYRMSPLQVRNANQVAE